MLVVEFYYSSGIGLNVEFNVDDFFKMKVKLCLYPDMLQS